MTGIKGTKSIGICISCNWVLMTGIWGTNLTEILNLAIGPYDRNSGNKLGTNRTEICKFYYSVLDRNLGTNGIEFPRS